MKVYDKKTLKKNFIEIRNSLILINLIANILFLKQIYYLL